MRSPVYWHPLMYQFTMRVLYGRYFQARYRAIADLIPENSSVVEVCAGDAYLYRNYLKKKNVKYTGLDINPVFINSAKRKNIPFAYCDVMKNDIPAADHVIIHASLYQFIPNEHTVLRKLLNAAGRTLIVSEPVRNLADSSNAVISFLAKYSANPDSSHAVKRFNKEMLLFCFKQYSEFRQWKEAHGGRELIGVFRK